MRSISQMTLMKNVLSIAMTALILLTAGQSFANVRVTILHNNDGESHLTAAGNTGVLPHYGNVCRFRYVLDSLRTEAAANTDGSIFLSSGDNFLAGPEYDASVAAGFSYDALALDGLAYDALSFGNHDFDFTPDVTQQFVSEFTVSQPPFLCCNADFSAEPAMQALVTAGRIKKATTVVINGDTIAIVGAITPMLPFISSPRDVVIDPNVVGAVQAQVDSLTNLGINKIILIAHLQSIQEDSALIRQIQGIDLAIAGGGSEVLSNGQPLVPGDVVYGPYPLLIPDLNNNNVPVITTEGAYKYVGKCVVEFDNFGTLISVSGGPVRVNDQTVAGGVPAEASCQAAVVDPVNVHIATLASTIIGVTEVPLEVAAPTSVALRPMKEI
jgi:5'-nucleotidase